MYLDDSSDVDRNRASGIINYHLESEGLGVKLGSHFKDIEKSL